MIFKIKYSRCVISGNEYVILDIGNRQYFLEIKFSYKLIVLFNDRMIAFYSNKNISIPPTE